MDGKDLGRENGKEHGYHEAQEHRGGDPVELAEKLDRADVVPASPLGFFQGGDRLREKLLLGVFVGHEAGFDERVVSCDEGVEGEEGQEGDEHGGEEVDEC